MVANGVRPASRSLIPMDSPGSAMPSLTGRPGRLRGLVAVGCWLQGGRWGWCCTTSILVPTQHPCQGPGALPSPQRPIVTAKILLDDDDIGSRPHPSCVSDTNSQTSWSTEYQGFNSTFATTALVETRWPRLPRPMPAGRSSPSWQQICINPHDEKETGVADRDSRACLRNLP